MGAWRLTFMLWQEAGPLGLFQKIREGFGIRHDSDGAPFDYPDGSIFSCLGCLSVWVGLALWLLPLWISAVLAVSTIAIFMQNIQERVTRGKSFDEDNSLD